jgi:hypothetical protein
MLVAEGLGLALVARHPTPDPVWTVVAHDHLLDVVRLIRLAIAPNREDAAPRSSGFALAVQVHAGISPFHGNAVYLGRSRRSASGGRV